MEELNHSVEKLNFLIESFKFEEALNEFYHPNVVIAENEQTAIDGLTDYRIAARVYMDNAKDYSARLIHQIIQGNLVASLWHYKFNHKEWGVWDKHQLSVQRWKDGKIINERHYYE